MAGGVGFGALVASAHKMIFSVGGGEAAQAWPASLRISAHIRLASSWARGGMGAVYEAVHETIGRRAAVKFLNAPLARHAATSTRFFNEARAVSLVEHPGLVQIYDSGQLPDGTAYIIMELIRGETVADRLKREGACRPRRPCDSPGSSPKLWPRCMSKTSSTAISSPPT